MGRRLWIIADDYGLGEMHDAVIRRLLSDDHIHATSVLADTCTPASAHTLLALWTPERRVGLHFNLTWGSGLPGRSELLARSALGFGGKAARTALDEQWQKFERLFGRPPDYIDGHEHCHAFPSVRPVVLEFAAQKDVAVRSMVPLRSPRGLKARVISGLGRAIGRDARRRGIRTNARFGGVLPLDSPADAASLLGEDVLLADRMASELDPGSEIWVMTHPGDDNDPVQIPGHPALLRSLEVLVLSSVGATS